MTAKKIFSFRYFNSFETGNPDYDSAGKTEKTKLYLTALKQNDKPTENVSFIIDILSQYISQKSNDK